MRGIINCKRCGRSTNGLVSLNKIAGIEMFGICETCKKELSNNFKRSILNDKINVESKKTRVYG